jgi:hypothetical protein
MSTYGGGWPCQALNGRTVCRFHDARIGGAERQAESGQGAQIYHRTPFRWSQIPAVIRIILSHSWPGPEPRGSPMAQRQDFFMDRFARPIIQLSTGAGFPQSAAGRHHAACSANAAEQRGGGLKRSALWGNGAKNGLSVEHETENHNAPANRPVLHQKCSPATAEG